VPFTSGSFDTQFTIYLGGNSPGTAGAQVFPETLFVTDFSMYAATTISTNLEGTLSLLNGNLNALSIYGSNSISSPNIDATNFTTTNLASFQGPVVCIAGFTGATGYFQSMNASTLTVSNTATFGPIAATSVNAGSVNTTALTSGAVAASSGFIATSGAGFQVFSGTSSPFFVNGQGNTSVNTLTVSGTANLQTLTCTAEMDTGALTVSGTGSFGTVISTNQITSLGGFLAKGTTAGFGLYSGSSFPFLVDGSGNTTTQNLTVQGTTSLQALTCTGETDTGTLAVSGTGSFGTVKSNGDVTYNGSTSLISSLSTLSNHYNGGTFSATTNWGTFYTFPNPGRGFVVVSSAVSSSQLSTAPGMCMCFFEWTQSWPSLTLLATSYNAQQSNLSSAGTASGGTQTLFIQQNGTTGQIQVKVSTAITVQWAVLLW